MKTRHYPVGRTGEALFFTAFLRRSCRQDVLSEDKSPSLKRICTRALPSDPGQLIVLGGSLRRINSPLRPRYLAPLTSAFSVSRERTHLTGACTRLLGPFHLCLLSCGSHPCAPGGPALRQMRNRLPVSYRVGPPGTGRRVLQALGEIAAHSTRDSPVLAAPGAAGASPADLSGELVSGPRPLTQDPEANRPARRPARTIRARSQC